MTDEQKPLVELWHNWYLKYTLFEDPNCKACFGDLVVHFQGKPMARFCNSDLSEMLPVMQEFVERKRKEDEQFDRERDLLRIDEIFAELQHCTLGEDGKRYRELDEELERLRNKYPEEADAT